MSLFSVFDPCVWGFNLNWVVFGGVFFGLLVDVYVLGSVVYGFFMVLVSGVMSFFVGISGEFSFLVLVSVGIFFFISIVNLLGLYPFIFCVSAHPAVTLNLAMLFWLSCFLMGWIKNFKVSAAHLTPEGCPLIMAFFLVIVESVSHLIRPFTLAIRLAANMMAGHLIVGLLSVLSVGSFLGFGFSVFFQFVLLLLELGVMVIQAVVFSILFSLYAVEYY